MEFSPRCLKNIPFTHALSTIKEWQNTFGSPTLCTRFNIKEDKVDIYLLKSTFLQSDYKKYPLEILVEILRLNQYSDIKININMDGTLVGAESEIDRAEEVVEKSYTVRNKKES